MSSSGIGRLWGEQTELARRNFVISGDRMPPEVITDLARIKKFAATTNATLGVLAWPTAHAIVAAAQEILDGHHPDQFPVDVFQTGSGTSTNMNVNEVIARRAGEILGEPVHPNDDVNASQSSNDVFASVVRIATARVVSEATIPALAHLADVLAEVSAEHGRTVKAGRTHLMDAAPLTFGQEVGGWRRSIELAAERLGGVLPRLLELPLGGTAVGTGLNAPPGFGELVIRLIAENTGIDFRPATDRFESLSAPESLVETSAMARSSALAMNKIAGDLRLLSSGPNCGLGELTLAELQAGSSIMPGKVNPVIPEVVQQIAAQVVGNDAAIVFAAAMGSTLQLNTAMPVIARNLLESCSLLATGATALADSCLKTITVNTEMMFEYARKSPAMATVLNPVIGYDAATRIVKEARATGRSILEVARESGISERTLAAMDPLQMALGAGHVERSPSGPDPSTSDAR